MWLKWFKGLTKTGIQPVLGSFSSQWKGPRHFEVEQRTTMFFIYCSWAFPLQAKFWILLMAELVTLKVWWALWFIWALDPSSSSLASIGPYFLLDCWNSFFINCKSVNVIILLNSLNLSWRSLFGLKSNTVRVQRPNYRSAFMCKQKECTNK